MKIEWKLFSPFYFYVPLTIILIVAARLTETRSSASFLLLYFIGIVSWGLLEYGLHRFVFHHEASSALGRKLLSSAHLSHHAAPNSVERLFARLQLSTPIAAVYFLLIWGLLGAWQSAAAVFTGLTTGYCAYEFMHYLAHQRAPRSGLFRYLKKYHMLHHYGTSESRFGVTSPIFDYLFGTFKPVKGQSKIKQAH